MVFQKLKLAVTCPALRHKSAQSTENYNTGEAQTYFHYDCSVVPNNNVGRDSSVGIATRYRLDGPEIESRWGRDFPHPSKPALGPTQPPT
jgi:hypothetical protein